MISLLSVYERNIFRAQMFQIIDEFSCNSRVCIFYVIDATRHVRLCKKAGSCYCGVFNVYIILKCVSIENLSFKMYKCKYIFENAHLYILSHLKKLKPLNYSSIF